jgi:predicted MPP superfamily phosphohydrolase
MRIAMIADLHANRSNVDEADIEALVAQANALEPDLTVLLGDYCSQDRGALAPERVAHALRGLRARLGVFAVQGNHDWRDDRAAMRSGHGPTRTERAFREAGIPLLENRAVRLPGERGLWVAGIESEQHPASPRTSLEDFEAHRARRLAETLADVPAGEQAILLAHEPDIFASALDPRVAVTLSGHTHGGQVRILGWAPLIPSRFGMRYALGHIRERGRDLVVSGGIGSHFVAGYPLRIGVPPELVALEISAPAAA